MNEHVNVKPDPDWLDDLRVTGPAVSSGNAARGAAIVVIRSDDPTFSKSYRLVDGRLRKSQGAAVLVSGLSRLIEAPTATALAEIINKFTASNQALCVGRYTDRNLTETRLTSRRNAEPGAIERNGETFGWNDGPGWVLCDVDYSDTDDENAVFEMLHRACPALEPAAVVIRRSTSCGIFNTATGAFFDGGGWHVFVLLDKQSDGPRFLKALHARLWLADCGFIRIGANGRPYSKSPVDQLLEPERIVFEGKPELGHGLSQKPRVANAHDGMALDSKTACRDLSDEEKGDFARRVAEAQALVQPDCDRIHAKWKEEQVAERVARGVPEDKAREAAQRLSDGGALDEDHELHFKHLGVATVGQVLTNVGKYRDKPMADPIEGPEYGEDCAYVRVKPDGTVWINSYAHGGTEYAYLRVPARADVADVLDGVEEPPKGAEHAEKADGEAGATKQKKKCNIISMAECYESEGASVDTPLVKELLDLGAVSVLYGPSNIGKSFDAASLCYAVGVRAAWGGLETTQGASLYVAYEGTRRFKRRLAALLRHHGKPAPVYLTRPPDGSLYSAGWVEAMLASVAEAELASGQKVLLIIVDTLTASRAGGETKESDNDDMSDAYAVLVDLALRSGAHVMVIHHSGKDELKGMRGGSSLPAAVDTVLRRIDKKIIVEKQRDYDKGPAMEVELVVVTFPELKGGATSRVSIVKAGRVGEGEAGDAFPLLDKPDSKAKLLRGRILELLRARAAEAGRPPYLRSELGELVRGEKLIGDDDAGRTAFSKAVQALKGEGVARSGKGASEVVLWIELDRGR